MDTTEREEVVRHQQYARSSLESGTGDVGVLLQLLAGYETRLANFIPAAADSTEGMDEWRRVSAELWQSNHSENDSHFSPSTLPKVRRTQHNRFRLEEEDFLLIRQPFFSQYERAVLSSQQQFFGLTGPQGFGKSTFLHYFATKYCCGGIYIVVYVPVCPTDTNLLKVALAEAFYRGCQIADLSGYNELTSLDTLPQILIKCARFAASKQKTLLLLIDQMKVDPQDFFSSTIHAICNMTGQRIKVIMSSWISNRFSSVFGNRIQSLDRYAHRITPAEAELLATHPSTDDITALILTELPFQVAAEKLKGMQVSLVELANSLAEDLLTNPGASNQQAYFYLQMTADATKKDNERDCNFGFTLEGDYFYVDVDSEGRFFIAEHREGFAAEVIAIMRSRQGDYERYLLQVLDNANFMTLDAGARGRIVEDCFAIILRGQAVVQLPFVKIPGSSATQPNAVRLEPQKKRVFDVQGGDEEVLGSITWLAETETLAIIPLNRQYKGIDFIVARRTGKTLYIYFLQCTIQLPQNHPICESELYTQWESVLKSSSTCSSVRSCLVFLTPHSANLGVPGPASTAAYFRRKTKLHVRFSSIEGDNELLAKIRTRFAGL